jgi:hypothetical protein
MKAIMIDNGRQNDMDVAVLHEQRYRVSGEKTTLLWIA